MQSIMTIVVSDVLYSYHDVLFELRMVEGESPKIAIKNLRSEKDDIIIHLDDVQEFIDILNLLVRKSTPAAEFLQKQEYE